MWGGNKEQSLSPLWKQFSLKINSFGAGLQENFLPPQDTSGWGGGTARIEAGRWPGKSWGVQGGSKRGRLEAAKGGTIKASH